jgi:hypothetical protein
MKRTAEHSKKIYEKKSLKTIQKYNGILLNLTSIFVVRNESGLYVLSNGRKLKSSEMLSVINGGPITKKYLNELLSNDENIVKKAKQNIKKEVAIIGAQSFHEKSKKEGYPKGKKPWNKGLTVEEDERVKNKTKGLNKNNNEKMKKFSEDRMGAGNPMFGKHHSDDHKKKQSEAMKGKIYDGSFTPNTNNRLTHAKKYFYDNKKFRSSWELLYYLLCENDYSLEYETIRIKYIEKDNKSHIYIVDFVDHVNKKLIEIKPLTLYKKAKSKFLAAEKWCEQNGYTFVLVNEMWFLENRERISSLNYDEEFKNKKYKEFGRYVHKIDKKNRKTECRV